MEILRDMMMTNGNFYLVLQRLTWGGHAVHACAHHETTTITKKRVVNKKSTKIKENPRPRPIEESIHPSPLYVYDVSVTLFSVSSFIAPSSNPSPHLHTDFAPYLNPKRERNK